MIKIKPVIKIKFTDFWEGFDLPAFMFYKLLIEKYEVVISNKPEILFYSVYGHEHLKYTCTKVLFSAENVRPNFRECDFAFSFDYTLNKRNYRLPLYAFYDDVTRLLNRKVDESSELAAKTKFCCFVVSNPSGEIRNQFFNKLAQHKQVDSGGLLFNNIGGPVDNKRDFIRNYKFVIAFENSSYPGYVTEKIFEPFLENCVPIYWGDPLIGKEFNTRRFINSHDFNSFDEVIKHVLEVDQDDEKYLEYLREPVFVNNQLNDNLKIEHIAARLDEIITFNSNRTWMIKKYQKIRPAYAFAKYNLHRITHRLNRIITH